MRNLWHDKCIELVRIINPYFTHLDINLIVSVLLAQFMCPTLCKLSITYPQQSNLPYLTHVAHGKAQGIKSALFLASQAPFCFFYFIPYFFSVLRKKEKLDQVRLTSFFVLHILLSFLHEKSCMSCHSTTLQLA